MTRQQRAAVVLRRLGELYPETPIPLDHRDAFTLLVAVVLSAQCTDKRVNLVTPALFDRAATPAAMAALPVDTIREIIRPCGLSPQKSKALKELSRLLLERHGGQVPRTFEELEALPGVGHKTASVVMAQAFGVPAFSCAKIASSWSTTIVGMTTRRPNRRARISPRLTHSYAVVREMPRMRATSSTV